jgi:cytochrome P450
MKKSFTPPYPKPQAKKNKPLKRLIRGWKSWTDVLYEKSYTAKLGVSWFPAAKQFLIGDAKLVDKVLFNKNNQFPKHKILAKLLTPAIGSKSVFITNGELWKEQRKMMSQAFLHTNLKRSFDMMAEASDVMIDKLKKRSGSNIKIDLYMTHVTADIIYRTIFSKSLSSEEAQIVYKNFHDYQTFAQRRFILNLFRLPTFFSGKLAKKHGAQIRNIFTPHITKRYGHYHSLLEKEKNEHKDSDILDSLLRSKSPNDGRQFTVEEIIDQVAIIFLAGHETSAASLSWSLYLIAKSADLQEELYQEIKENPIQEHEDIKHLSKLKNVFQESLRLYPPVSFFMRQSSCPLKWRDKLIRTKDILVISPWLIQRSKNHWKNPHEFDPARFDTADKEAQLRCPMHENSIKDGYLPFGKGPRICIGAGFAMQEAMIILSNILREFKILYKENDEPEVVSRVTTRSKNGIYLYLEER